MQQYSGVVLFLLMILPGCGTIGSSIEKSREKMALTFEVRVEDSERNWYYVTWDDTLGKSEGYLDQPGDIQQRPREIWCVITGRNNDTLGDYRGMSTVMTYADFHPADSVVTLNFMTGPNFFSEKVFEEGEFEGVGDFQEYMKENGLPVMFEPVEVNIRRDLGKEVYVELKEKAPADIKE